MIENLKKNKIFQLVDSLDLDNKKLLLIAIVAIVVFYIDFSFILKVQMNSINKLNSKIKTVKQDLTNFERDYKSLQDFNKRQGMSSSAKEVRPKRLIFEYQVASLLQDIAKSANANNIRIVQMKNSKEPQVKSDKSGAIGKFPALFITLDLICDYHSLGKFINDLENGDVFVAVQDLRINYQEQDPNKQKVVLILKSYVKK